MSEFTDQLHEVFAGLGPVQVRRMFGGHGVFHDGLMIGLVADSVLYLKADRETIPRFADRGMEPFVYHKSGNPVRMSYYTAPEEIYEDADEARHWADLALAAAVRSKR